MESNENGIWVEFRDYLRLLEDYKSSQQWKREADAETLKFDSGDWFASKTLPERIKHIIEANAFSNDQWKDVDAENARLKSEVKRLEHEVRYWKIEAKHDHERWLNALAELDKHVKDVPRPSNEA